MQNSINMTSSQWYRIATWSSLKSIFLWNDPGNNLLQILYIKFASQMTEAYFYETTLEVILFTEYCAFNLLWQMHHWLISLYQRLFFCFLWHLDLLCSMSKESVKPPVRCRLRNATLNDQNLLFRARAHSLQNILSAVWLSIRSPGIMSAVQCFVTG